MPDGEWLRALLESVGWGFGATHLALSNGPCSGCNGTRTMREGDFEISCTTCSVRMP